MGEDNAPLTEEWWTDSQKQLVEDKSRIWQKKKFSPVAGYWILKDGYKILGKAPVQTNLIPQEAVFDEHAWDHEHCELCWQAISEHMTHQQKGYTDGKEWICCGCYSKYIIRQAGI